MVEVADVTEQINNLTRMTSILSVADVEFVAQILLDLATATGATNDLVQEATIEKEVKLSFFLLVLVGMDRQ